MFFQSGFNVVAPLTTHAFAPATTQNPPDSDDAAMSFRDHAAIHSGLIPPPCVGLFDGLVLG
jgi:hypothetical protein